MKLPSSETPKVPEVPAIKSPKTMVEQKKVVTPVETMKTETPKHCEGHKHPFVGLWMPIAAFIMIVIAYLYCHLTGLETNGYREIATLGISGIFAAICWWKLTE